MMKVRYFIAVQNDDHEWVIGDEPYFPFSAADRVAEGYQQLGWTVEVVEQLTRTVARYEGIPQ